MVNLPSQGYNNSMSNKALKFGTPQSNLIMSVSDVRATGGMIEFDIHPPSPLSHVMTLYSPQNNVEVRPLSYNNELGDMYVTDNYGNTIFLIQNTDQ
jgi:hypothetical protein